MTPPTSSAQKSTAGATRAKAKATTPSPAIVALRAMRQAQRAAQHAREAADLGKTGHSGRTGRLVNSRGRLRGRSTRSRLV
jgi:hypothetical protein